LCGISSTTAQIVISNDTVLLLNNDFNFNLGTGFLDVRWTGSGGFASLSGDHYVKLNNSIATLDWDAPNFVGADNTLIFGATNAAGTVIWDKGLNINVTRARIRVIKGTQAEATQWQPGTPVAVLNQVLSGSGQLWIEGDGLIAYKPQSSPGYTGKLAVVGAELEAKYYVAEKPFLNSSKIDVGGAGKLTQHWVSSDPDNATRAGPVANLYGATFRMNQNYAILQGGSALTYIPDIHIKKGANRIEYGYSNSYFNKSVTQVTTEFYFPLGKTTTTLNIAGMHGPVDVDTVSSLYPYSDAPLSFRVFHEADYWAWDQFDIFVPKLVLRGDSWGRVRKSGEDFLLVYPVEHDVPGDFTYLSYSQTDIAHVDINGSESYTETAAKSIRTLRIGNATQEVSAIVNNDTLTINLGGILKRMSSAAAKFQTLKEINTPAGVNLVIHNYSDGALTLEGKLNLGNDGLVKAGKGDLYLRGGPYIFSGNTILGTSHINEGSVYLDQDVYLGASAIGGTVRVAFGAQAPGRLIVARNEQIADTSTVVLDAVAIDGEGGISRHLPVFQIGNAVRVVEHIHTLRVEGGGVIRFSGAASGTQTTNQLFIQALQIPTITNANGSLFVQNWIDGITYFLISRTAPNFMAALDRIHFLGWDPGAILRNYDANNWEIIPMGAPEPSTYGIILGAVGLGLWTWQRKRRATTK